VSSHIHKDTGGGLASNRLDVAAAYLADLIESSDDAIIAKDMSGVITAWNRGAQAIFGYDARDVIGQPIKILFPPDRLEEEDLIMASLVRGDRIEHHETVRRRKNGSDFPVSVTISPIRDGSGVIVGAGKILRDITERHEAQRALALSEAEFRASFECAAVGKVLTDPLTRTIVRVNQAFARIIGYQPDALIGRRMTAFIASEDRAADAAEYARLLDSRSSAQILELRLVRADGAPTWVRASASLALSPDDGRPFVTIIAIEDIDARHKAQLDLVEALAERDLLLREVYHRVKNNLQVIDAMLAFGEQKIDDPNGIQLLRDLRTRIHAIALVHNQLMGSKNLNTFDVAPFIQQLCQNIFEGAAGLHIKMRVAADPLDVGLDFAVPLGLVVTELVTNAFKHAFPDGIGEVSVILRPGDDGRIVLTVSDNGVGQSADPGAAPRSGLGSKIVNSLVAQLQGEIAVYLDGGTTTVISLPPPETP
jgi:PAS domain S-box-containing protein